MPSRESAIRHALAKLLTPLVRLLLRNGVAFAEFAEVARKVYVDVAASDFSVPGRKQTHSRIAVLTGIHRREVTRLREIEQGDEPPTRKRNRAARVISGWMNDPDFCDNGKPKPLGVVDEFADLVRRHGGDIPPRSVLDEMLRVGAVERSDDDRLSLRLEAYSPVRGDSDWFAMFGECAADLLGTLDHNFVHPREASRLQLAVCYDNIPEQLITNVRSVSQERSMEFLQDLNAFMRTQDKDCNDELQASRRVRAGVGLYYFEQPFEEDNGKS